MCFSKGDEYGVSRGDVMDAAYLHCVEVNPNDSFDFNDDNGRDETRTEMAWSNAAIEIATMRVEHCDEYPEDTPQIREEYSCYDITYGAWEKCYGNGGRGGAIDVGCMRYSVRPFWNTEGDLSEIGWEGDASDYAIVNGEEC